MSARVIGLDVSTACTGLALPDGRTASIRPKTKLHKVDPPFLRAKRNSEIADALAVALRDHAAHVDVAVVEGYLLSGPGGPWVTIRLAEVGAHIRLVLYRLHIRFVEIPPSTNKRWACGKGGATKEEMVLAARAGGAMPSNDNEADAWHLRAIGLAAYSDWDFLTDEQRLVLTRYDWPVLREAVPA